MTTHDQLLLWHALYQLEARYWHEVDCNGGRDAHQFYLSDGLMVVGHNPSITEFLARMIAKSGSEALVDFKKGAVAKAETVRHSARLNWFFTPKMAREIQAAAAAAAEKSRTKTSRK